MWFPPSPVITFSQQDGIFSQRKLSDLPVSFGSYQWRRGTVVSTSWSRPFDPDPSISWDGLMQFVATLTSWCVCVCVCVWWVWLYYKQQGSRCCRLVIPNRPVPGLCDTPVACIHLYNCPVAPHTESTVSKTHGWQVASASRHTHTSRCSF